jgi:hypothetical protein
VAHFFAACFFMPMKRQKNVYGGNEHDPRIGIKKRATHGGLLLMER